MSKPRKPAPEHTPTRPEGQKGSPARARFKARRAEQRAAQRASTVSAIQKVHSASQ